MSKEDYENTGSSEDRIGNEASGWVIKRDQGFTAEEQDAFFEWLAADPDHRDVYSRRLALFEDMNLLEDWKPKHSSRPNPDLLANGMRKSRRMWFAGVCSIAASLVIGMFLYLNRSNTDEVNVVTFGGDKSYENHVLEDGSVVEMNSGTRMSVTYSKDERLIDLHAGEVHFMVAKDPDRPFLVKTGGVVVQATGTAFNVLVGVDGIEVLVTEGRVRLNSKGEGSGKNGSIVEIPLERELVAGQKALVARGEKMPVKSVDTVSKEEIERRLAWKGEILDFTDERLWKVAREFNRRNTTKLILAEAELQDLEITAKLRSNKLDSFVRLLELTQGVRAEKESNFEIYLYKSDKS